MRLADLEGGARKELVVDFLREEVARALGIAEPLAVDVEQGLFEMGMDSLMSVELKSRIERAVGSNLPSTLTFNYPNILALAGYVVTEVLPESSAAVAPASPARTAETNRDETSGETNRDETSHDDASEDELAAMLASRLAKLQ
ncbi:MAG: acyl carrier protein [Actinomycetota bacterium]|nr:acyl carrier protein [Actinomycetota bacterium]